MFNTSYRQSGTLKEVPLGEYMESRKFGNLESLGKLNMRKGKTHDQSQVIGKTPGEPWSLE